MNVSFLFSPLRLAPIGLSLAALIIGTSFAANTAQAQVNGYDFGIGWGWAQQPWRLSTPREDLPYFTKFPPVYYGDMVRRPYGYSPYALPPGIEPVEQRILQQTMGPRTIVNPFFERNVISPAAPPAPAADPAPPAADVAPALPPIEDSDVAARRA
jgi:hypothetical protein